MSNSETDPDYYLEIARTEGIGELNDWETAVRREIQSQEEMISTFVENAEQGIEETYSDNKTLPALKANLLEWIEAAIPGENPDFYLDDGFAESHKEDVLPRLFLEDEESRETWTDYRSMIRTCRLTIQILESRLHAIETARQAFLFRPDSTENLPNVLKGKSKSLRYAEEIVDKYENDASSLPEDMGPFKERWIKEKGNSKVTRLQTVIREAGLSEHYEDGNPESFCDLLERLVRRYYADQSSGTF